MKSLNILLLMHIYHDDKPIKELNERFGSAFVSQCVKQLLAKHLIMKDWLDYSLTEKGKLLVSLLIDAYNKAVMQS